MNVRDGHRAIAFFAIGLVTMFVIATVVTWAWAPFPSEGSCERVYEECVQTKIGWYEAP